MQSPKHTQGNQWVWNVVHPHFGYYVGDTLRSRFFMGEMLTHSTSFLIYTVIDTVTSSRSV